LYKTFYIFLFFILFCCEAKTQTEYITNGSFEQIDSCYGNYAPIGLDVFEWSGCKAWSNPIKSSSDLWCENPKLGLVTPPFIPSAGYQIPRTGNNFAGMHIGYTGYANYREYVQNKLSQTLKINKNYTIVFYLSKGVMPCTTNQFGVKFFNTKHNDATTYWLTNLTPDAINDENNFITDTLGWQKLSMQYKANGTENYIIIGCFTDSSKVSISSDCDTTGYGNFIPGVGYFFIDDVSIIEIEMPALPNVFSPNGDGINDIWKAEFDEEVQFYIYNRWGNIVYEQKEKNIYWNGTNYNDGVYYYIIYSNQYYYKGFIQLIR
jgi:gliding motility-associated-like protein